MKMPNGKMSRAVGAAAVAVVLLGASVLAAAKRPGHAGQPGQGHGLAKFPGFPVPEVIGPPSPQAVLPGSATFTLRVFGANYIASSVVNWNRQPRATTVISGHEVDAQILASDVAQPTSGIITVTSTTPGGTVTSSSYNFVEVHTPTATFVVGSDQNYFGGGPPLTAGDVNGDGRLDLGVFTASGGYSEIKTFLGNADGSFTPGKAATFSYFGGGGPAAFADFNGDGNLDLLYTSGPAHGLPPEKINVNLGDGQDGFHHGHHVGTFAGPPCCAAIGDFNQDGVLDVAVDAGFGINLHLGNGDGSFSNGGRVNLDRGAVLGMVAGDFNGDGKLDLAAEIALQTPTRIEIIILLGNGDGTFQPARTVVKIHKSNSDTKLIATDLNGDGILDIVYTDNEQLGVLLGAGDGTFEPPAFYSPPRVLTMVAGDFNSDGKMDLIVLTAGAGGLAVLLGNGDGTLQSAQRIPTQPGTGAAVVGDFNSDGLLDLAGGAFRAGLVVLLQK